MGEDLDAEKQALEARHCDPSIRGRSSSRWRPNSLSPPRTEGRTVTGITVESATSTSGGLSQIDPIALELMDGLQLSGVAGRCSS